MCVSGLSKGAKVVDRNDCLGVCLSTVVLNSLKTSCHTPLRLKYVLLSKSLLLLNFGPPAQFESIFGEVQRMEIHSFSKPWTVCPMIGRCPTDPLDMDCHGLTIERPMSLSEVWASEKKLVAAAAFF